MKILLSLTVIFIACTSFGCAQTPKSGSLTTSPPPEPQTSKSEALTESQAVELAEKFLARNGYTDAPPDRNNLSYESIEWESNLDALLKTRHDTLEKEAFGVLPNRKSGAAGWTVVFRYAHPSDSSKKKNGRAVTMNADGSEMRVEHVDFILAMVDKKLKK